VADLGSVCDQWAFDPLLGREFQEPDSWDLVDGKMGKNYLL